ncbi:MAG: Rv2993c-like domain-containing protein [Solirubrobacteraceae bacterium]
MKLATFDAANGSRVGIVEGDEVVGLTAADPSLATMIDLLDRDPARAASAIAVSAPRVALAEVKLRPPVPRPRKFLAILSTRMAQPARGSSPPTRSATR